MATRLGVVSYLNTKPLVRPFETGELDYPFELIYDVPSVCAEKLHQEETDVALIPLVEIARAPEPYRIVPHIGIGSLGPVRSVFLVLNKEPEEIKTLALDASSRTSVALSKVVLAKQFGCRPDFFSSTPDLEQMLSRADAALLIGDPALELDVKRYRVLDLGEAWTEMTGLPFVYACWTGRSNAIDAAGIGQLLEAKALGLEQIGEIAEIFAAANPLPSAFYAAYLTRHIRFDLGESELDGIRRFFAYAFELGLIEQVPNIQVYET